MSVYISKTSWIDSFCQKHGRTILYHNHAITPDQCVCLGIVGYFQRGLNGKSKTRSARYSSMTLCRPQLLRRQKLYAQNLYCGNSGSLQNHFRFVIYLFLLVRSFLQILHWENGHKRSVFHFWPRVILITVSYPSPQAKRLLVDASKGQDHLMSWFLHFGEAETNMYHDGLTLEVFHYVQKPGVRMIKHGCIERLQGEGLLHSVFILIFGVVLHVESWEFVNWYADRPGVIQIHEWQRLQCKSRFFAHFKSCLISIARILDNGLASLRGRWGRASPSLYLFALKSWHLLGMIFTKIGKVELGETPTNTLLWSYW